MPDVDLAHRPGVELVNVGSWQLLSGSWNPNPKDILAAVEAAQCPAVRRPKLKLGHLDPRFNTPDDPTLDGTPSLGWYDNLRASEDGNTLIGDQVALPWLNAVQAAAYPDRSIEGKYNKRCALGHVHPFVIEAVSLLGETPPGIPTLKSITSLEDLPAALGVAAAGDEPEGGESVQATVRAAAADEAEPADDGDEPEHTGAIIALVPVAEDAARLAVDGGEPAGELHLTLAYLGEAADLGAQGQQDIIDAVSSAINGMPTVDGAAFAVTAFNPGDATEADTCLVYGVTGDLLDAVHDVVMQALDESTADVPPQILPWVAHITAEYTDDLSRLSELASRLGPVRFDRVRLAFAGQYTDIPLIDDGDGPDPEDFAEDSLEVPNILMPVAAASADKLREYWVHGRGASKIRWGEKNDFYRCVKQLRRFVADPKGLCNTYHREALGVAPGQEHVHAAAGEFDEHKHPRDHDGKFAHTAGGKVAAVADRAATVKASDGKTIELGFHDGAMTMRIPHDEHGDGEQQHAPDHFDSVSLDAKETAEFADDFDVILEERARYLAKAQVAWDRLTELEDSGKTSGPEYTKAQDDWFAVGGDGQRIAGGEVPGNGGGALVYELRMGHEVTDTEFVIGLRPPDAGPDWDLQETAADHAGAFLKMAGFRRLKKELAPAAVAASAPTDLPAAEPEHEETPTEEDPVSLSDDMRSRLGLDAEADEVAALAAIDALISRAEKPAEPTPEMVAASAAATETAERAVAAQELMKEELTRVSGELAEIKASAAATVKASFFSGLVTTGKLKPADRETWETRYDRDPQMVSEILSARAEGSEVPVMASGSIGTAEPGTTEDPDAEFEREFAGLFSPKAG
jgi:hypothetical protein